MVLFATSCAKDAPQTTLVKGPKAEIINNLINPVFGVAGVVFVLILGGALFVSLAPGSAPAPRAPWTSSPSRSTALASRDRLDDPPGPGARRDRHHR
ncbi:MAG: hypothetical protein R2746_14650 [Acidimicrobiales bacterium]